MSENLSHWSTAPSRDGRVGMQLCFTRRPHCTWQGCSQPWGPGRGEATGDRVGDCFRVWTPQAPAGPARMEPLVGGGEWEREEG